MEQRMINPAGAPPELSVVIPAHDAAATICGALDSVARQEGLHAEIIVADDASGDGTAEAAEAWGRAHSAVPLRVVRMERQVYAMRARLAGLELACAPDVIYLDADDSWAGTRRLARVLERKRRLACEIVHFRTQAFLDGKNEGELLWAAPPVHTQLRGGDIFAAYARLEYIPLVIWNKVYSRALLQKAAGFVGDSEIFCFEDKFFVSLVLMCARSWASANEYIYQYNRPSAYPEKKNAGRIHDLLALRKKVGEVFPLLGIDAEARRDYLNFITKRLTYHLGRLSIDVGKKLSHGLAPQEVLAGITPRLPMAQALPALVAAAHINLQRVHKISRRLHDES